MSKYAVVWDLNGVLFKRRILDENTLSIVKKLKEAGIKQYVCTNTRFNTLMQWIAEHGIDKYFKYIFSSRKIGSLKPDPRVFKYLKEHIVEKRILLVDDSWVNVKSARLVGLKAIRYTSDQQLLNELKLLDIYDDRQTESTRTSG